MGKENRSWKHPLLSTGRPLERSVVECVQAIPELRPIGEYSFESLNSRGVLAEHSVDLLARHSDVANDVGVDLLLESKYRHPGTKRVYRRAVPFTPEGPSLVGAFASTEDLVSGVFFDQLATRKHDYAFSFGFSPIEVVGSNGKVLPDCDDGGRQLVSAAAARLADAAIETLRTGVLRFVVPIAVTTCDLQVFREEPSIERVQAAKSLDELTERVEMIVCRHPVRDLEGQIHRRLASECAASERLRLDSALASRGIEGLSGLARILARRLDGTYVVVRYEDLAERLERAIRFCCAGVRYKANVRSIRMPSATISRSLAAGE